jgi:uncharacterized protein with ATP-grasp and redox domains
LLRVGEVGSFAEYTFRERLPEVLRRLINSGEFSPQQGQSLRALGQELRSGTVRQLRDRSAPDATGWDTHLAPFDGEPWATLPFFFAEAYFYRRILEATEYFPEQTHDPFRTEKARELHGALSKFRYTGGAQQLPPEFAVCQALSLALWGNSVDLSQIGQVPAPTPNEAQHRVLVDEVYSVVSRLRESERVDLIVDNAGTELLADLHLVDALFQYGVRRVVLHVKAAPTFVSDATTEDTNDTIAALVDSTNLRPLGERLLAQRAGGRLVLSPHRFWNSPLFFWDLPRDLRADLAMTNLAIIKGDANYRRLVGDCRWPIGTQFATLCAHFPAPLLALRVMKSEVSVGIPEHESMALDARNPDWRTNGRFAVAQGYNVAR